MATHIYGMAKSCLNTRGANWSRLHLDFLRLVYITQKHELNNESSVGYLQVLTCDLGILVKDWIDDYEVSAHVQVFSCSLLEDVDSKLRQEKDNNRRGNTRSVHSSSLSPAPYGRALAEETLKENILKIHSSLWYPEENAHTPRITWDFYAQAK